jgi:hypothetical protein
MTETGRLELGAGASLTGFSDVMLAGVLEPSTWAMLLIGFAGLGLVGYQQTRRGQAAGGVTLRKFAL